MWHRHLRAWHASHFVFYCFCGVAPIGNIALTLSIERDTFFYRLGVGVISPVITLPKSTSSAVPARLNINAPQSAAFTTAFNVRSLPLFFLASHPPLTPGLLSPPPPAPSRWDFSNSPKCLLERDVPTFFLIDQPDFEMNWGRFDWQTHSTVHIRLGLRRVVEVTRFFFFGGEGGALKWQAKLLE